MTDDKLPIVLVVEDEEHLNTAVQYALEDEDIDVHSVRNGKDGLRLLEATRIDVCTVDMRLPDMTGNNFISVAHKAYPHLRFIIYTGSISYSIPEDLLKIGIRRDQVFIKPFQNLTDFVDAVVKIHNRIQ